uniref:Actin-related protein 10 n=1 Tax=Talaromyces marneffei PM1 TaxID=1077442 RepID=A0A093XVH1_TALMA
MATTDSRHASKSSISALEAARARIRKDDTSFEPRTPPHHRNRSIVSSFGSSSSPLSSFRNEEDAIILEMGARSLRAGFEGESMPMCSVGFGPEESRKVGDYRGWAKPNKSTTTEEAVMDAEEWVKNHELWRMDLREVDLGLVEDKLERAVREIYNNYLLTDAGNARLVLVIRWAETTVTAIYEYRDITSKRTTRAMKTLMQHMGRMLSHLDHLTKEETEKDGKISVNFEYCEEAVSRFAWCKFAAEDEDLNKDVSIPSPSSPDAEYIQVSFSQFAKPVEANFFATGTDEHELDDDETPIHNIVYNALLELPPDIRGACMSRIIFVGGGSRIPGIRQRILNEVSLLVAEHGWDATRGRAVEEQQKRIQELRITRERSHVPEKEVDTTGEADEESSSEEKEEEIDFIEQKIRRNQARNSKPFIQGQFRQVESLGAWAGASLVTSLKIRGLVEVEREKFLRDGLASATRDLEGHHQVADRRSGVRSSVISDRSSWTLAGWG